MKKMLGLVGVGFLGLASLQGCAASVSSEEAENLAKSEEAVTNQCNTNSGMLPTKAALAVAMATELGRWAPDKDLVSVRVAAMPNNTQPVVQLSPSAVCIRNNCANTKAILGQQDWRLNFVVDQNVFNAVNFNSGLVQSVLSQGYKLTDLARNNPKALPPAHKLTLVGGPVNLGVGACGPHYVFQADHTDGTPLTSAEASNLANDLCAFDYGTCGNNPFIKFLVTGQGCPAGRTCVAIDPTDGDNGSGATNSAGSAPTYPQNRLYDPANSKLNSQCVTAAGKLSTMTSRCSALPSTCGYLYCT